MAHSNQDELKILCTRGLLTKLWTECREPQKMCKLRSVIVELLLLFDLKGQGEGAGIGTTED